MKTRIAFVPNSSSSSFIVIFPRMPKNSKEVFEFLFGNEDPNSYVYDNKAITYKEAAEIVFKDLKSKDSKPTQIKIMDLFVQRYYFLTHACGEGFYQMGYSSYCWGNDTKLVNKIREFTIEIEKQDDEYRKQLKNLLDKHITPVPYAWKDSKKENGEPRYTPKQVSDFEDYQRKEKIFRETNVEYKKLEKESWKIRNKNWKLQLELKKKLARKDIKLFKEKSKDKCVALLSYSDNDGDWGCAMEHGNIFDRLEHIRISNH